MNRRMLNSQSITTRGAKKNQIEETFTDIIKHFKRL